MSSLPIAPTGSAIIRLCSLVARVSYADDEDERVRESMIEAMLAARREFDAMLAISRRRCDGCRRYVEDARAYPSDGRCSKRGCTTMAHDCCSRWEAKP